MRYRWVVDTDHPQGHLVEMTAEEEAQADADAAAEASSVAAQGVLNANNQTLRSQVETRLTQLRTARDAIAAGNLFQALAVNERNVIAGLVTNDIGIGRLILRNLDGTD